MSRKLIKVYVSPERADRWSDLAEMSGLSLSGFVAAQVENGLASHSPEPPDQALREHIALLTRMGR